MVRPATTRRPWVVALMTGALLVTLMTGAGAKTPTPEPTEEPVRPAATIPDLAEGDAAVRFSLAPLGPQDTDLTLLTRWRTCGVRLDEDWVGRVADKWLDVPATARVVTTDDEVRIRVDVGAGPTGEPCESGALVRLPVALGEPLGDRVIVDVADARYVPVVNVTDSPDTQLTYSCDAGYPGGVGLTVPELLGPSLPVPPGLEAPVTTMRIVRIEGDAIHALGNVRPNGRVEHRLWRWNWQQEAWGGAVTDFACRLRADVSPNQATATWRLRGKRPDAKSRSIKVWVHEQVCNGRPVYGRVAQPIWINSDDGIILVAATMHDTVDYEGTYIDDPWTRWKGKPGVAAVVDSRFGYVDCVGLGPGPYTFNLHRRLGDRKLYDGAYFPPRERSSRAND